MPARSSPTEIGAMGAVDLTERVDPEGDHLIATAIVRNEGRLAERRAYVDAGRWDAVVGDFYDGTPARAASDAVERLGTGAVPLQATGDRLDRRGDARRPCRPRRRSPTPTAPELGPPHGERAGGAAVLRQHRQRVGHRDGDAAVPARKGVRAETLGPAAGLRRGLPGHGPRGVAAT